MSGADEAFDRGAEWMRGLAAELPAHAPIPHAINPSGTAFQGKCRCKWVAPVRRGYEGAKADAEADCADHLANPDAPPRIPRRRH